MTTITDDHELRVLLVDDEEPIRTLLTTYLGGQDGVRVVGTAAGGEEGVAAYAELRPDVVLMDLRMPGMNGVEATARIVELDPDACVLALTVMADPESIARMLHAGARGYLLKGTPPEDLPAHVRTVTNGGGVLSPQVAAALISQVRSGSGTGFRPDPPEAAPTGGERDVLTHLARGESNEAIATALAISTGTVKARLLAMSRRWGVSGRAQILRHARRQGYL